MKKYFIFLVSLLSFSSHALTVNFKIISFTIPDLEVKSVSVVNIEDSGLMLDGENWNMVISDKQFKNHCIYVKRKVTGLSCEDKDILNLFDSLYKDNKQKAMTYLFAVFDDWKKLYPDGFHKNESKDLIMYSLIPDKVTGSSYPHIVVIDKETGKNVYFTGEFDKKQFGWIQIDN